MAIKTQQKNERANQLIERLKSHPELLDRFESILDLAESKSGGADQLIAEADGSMIRLVANGADARGKRTREVSWHECRLCAAVQHGSTQPRYAATFAGVEELGRLWSRCAEQAGWAIASLILTLGDGAVWIDGQSAVCFGGQRWYLIDFYHVCEYLAAASGSCALKETPKRPDLISQKELR